ncbi:hypothetical protein [Flavisolibacter tropicus]|nr:hypothetical protein [Flavisolibacter tropicus]
MRTIKIGTLCMLLHAFALSAAAQNKFPLREPDYNKPALFDDLPSKLPFDINVVDELLDSPEEHSISIPLTKTLRFQGKVVSKSDNTDPNLKSIVIKSTNRLGATFTLTRMHNENGGFSYQGRIVSFKHGDAFELQIENGLYVLSKTKLYDLLSE